MGFSGIWSSNEAFSVDENEFIELPKPVEVSVPGVKSPLYVIRAAIPYGLGERCGSLLICESHNGGVAIKGWRFHDEEWNLDFLGGRVYLDKYSHLIKITSPEKGTGGYSKWIPNEEAWCNPGTAKYFFGFDARISDSCSCVNEEEMGFQVFMDIYWTQAKKLSRTQERSQET